MPKLMLIFFLFFSSNFHMGIIVYASKHCGVSVLLHFNDYNAL